jgi:microcin C transport system substrate-binding protein
MINRRHILKIAGLAPFANASPALADEPKFTHALSLFGDIKYQPGFKQFDYVNSNAPKTGKIRQWALGGFDSLNPNSLKGDPVAVTVLETLMVSSLDEAATLWTDCDECFAP